MRNSTIFALCLGALVSVAATASYAGGPFDAATRLLERGFASVPNSTPLSYTEDFGDLQLQGCSAAWSGSVCEQDWSAFGAASSVRMNELVTYPDVDVIMISPTQGSSNGVRRRFALESGADFVRFDAMAVAVGGSASFAMRVEFEDAQGATIETKTQQLSLSDHSKTLIADYPVPVGAVAAALSYAVPSGSSGTEVAVYANSGYGPCPNCHYPVDWPPGGWGDPGGGSGGDCPGESEGAEDPCACDISCPEGEEVFHECTEVADCVYVNICECVGVELGECELTDQGSYVY